MIKFKPFLDHLKSQKKMLMFQTDVFLQSRIKMSKKINLTEQGDLKLPNNLNKKSENFIGNT